MNKKGQAFQDHAVYSIWILISIIILIVAGLLLVVFNDVFSGSEFSSNNDIQKLRAGGLNAVTGFDIAVIILIVGMAVIIFMLSFFFENAPFFFGFFLLLLFIFMLISFPLVNGIYDFIQDTELVTTMARMPATNFFINNWVWVVLTYVVVSIVGFGAKARVSEDGGQL